MPGRGIGEVATIASPCMQVCVLDESGSLCIGCLRTAREIALWGSLSAAQRGRVIGALPERYRRIAGVEVPLETKRCGYCGIAFGCGAAGPEGACWCTRYPPVVPAEGATCLCPACLAASAT